MTERLNIRRMQMPEKSAEAELGFDPQRDITPADWAAMQNELSRVLGARRLEDSCFLAAAMQLLNPKTPIKISAEDRLWMRRQVEQVGVSALTFLYYAPQLAYIGEHPKIHPEITEAWVKNLLADNSPTDAAYLKELGIESDPVISHEECEKVLNRTYSNRRGRPYIYASTHSAATILGKAIPAVDWVALRENLEKLRQAQDWKRFANLAEHMGILAAGGVEISPEGNKLKRRVAKKDRSETSSQPPSLEI